MAKMKIDLLQDGSGSEEIDALRERLTAVTMAELASLDLPGELQIRIGNLRGGGLEPGSEGGFILGIVISNE